MASPEGANGPRHVGLVVDPLVLGQGQTEPEVHPRLEDSAFEPDMSAQEEAVSSGQTPEDPDDVGSPESLGPLLTEDAEPEEGGEGSAPSSSRASDPSSRPPESDQGDAGDGPFALRRGGTAVRERLLARARAAQRQSAERGRGSGGLEELDPELVASHRPLDAELDLVGAPLSPRIGPHLPRSRTGLSPTMTAVVGTLLGLATVASIVALAIHIDPKVALPQLARSPAASDANESARSPIENPSKQTPAPTAKKRHRKKIPGPWRVLDDKDKPGMRVIQGTIGHEAFLRVVQDKGVKKGQAYRLLKAFEGVVDLDKPKRSDQFLALVERGSGRLRAFEYVRSKEEVYQARENAQGYLRGRPLDLKIEHEQFSGAFVMRGSLDESSAVAGFEPGLRSVLETALRGHMDPDFNRGDRLRLVVQEVTALGEFSRYAGIEALEYISADGKDKKRIYYFRGTKERGYYDSRGRSPYEGGWRKPIANAPITSPFGMRMHPILKRKVLHAGIDFGAPMGTPVHASSFGKVSFMGYAGPAGNMVRLEHPGGIETVYFHLSRFEPGLKVGDKVKRLQVIGYVGSTGRSTGPHLHFGAKKDGKYFDPMSLKLDALRVIEKSEREAFDQAKRTYDKLLDSIPLPEPLEPQEAGTDSSRQFEPVAAVEDSEPTATGGSDAPDGPEAPPAPAAKPAEPAQRPSQPGSVIYLTDKELLDMQSGSDDGEVE